MSYILDALKKSDQERQQNAGPSLQTMQRPHVINRRSTAFNLTVVAIVALICFSVTVSWYFYTALSVKTDANVVNAPQTILEEDESAVVAATEKVLTEPDVSKKTTDDTGINPNKTESVEPKLIPDVVLQYWELPDPVQKAIPAMTFSFHVYSDNATRRTIIINNRRMREGSLVSEGLTLEEITQEGVIFNWKEQHRFSINVVENW